jgi:tellurite methyltransferase
VHYSTALPLYYQEVLSRSFSLFLFVLPNQFCQTVIMLSSKDKWNQRWHEKASRPVAPDPWLLRAMPFFSPGSVLDIACGRGRNSLYLAENGFTVTGVDISDQGLQFLEQEGAKRRLTLKLLQWDLETAVMLPQGPFDVILKFFYLQRSLLPIIKDTLRPGGVVVLRSFSEAGSTKDEPGNPDFILNPGELLDIFSGWDTLLYEEGLEESQTGGNLAGIVARKPETTDK